MRSQDVILGMLMDSSISGYDIKQNFEKLFSYFYNASYGTIYPTLSRMEKEGLITKQSFVQEGKPNKNVYTITQLGRKAFLEYLQSEIQNAEVKSDFMIRLFFGKWAEPALMIRWMEEGIRKTEETLAKLRTEQEQWKDELSPSQLICLRIGISNNEAVLANLQEGIAQIKSI
ncbi:PadR family transcriptional regulator [Paenibacillus turpanensis]|uniref:PadR family transcriptional regulator n=1 Tax=Paenibacillus turpanensis TaxID=2689078 RepID=UPI00140CFFF3|nr:PadR family transcriptional regulator [Paenibacillus turpanensis]